MKPYIKMLVLAGMLFAVGLCTGGCALSQSVGVVDRQRVMTESPKIKQQIAQMNAQLTAKGEEMAAQLAKDKVNLKPEDYQKNLVQAQSQIEQLKEGFDAQLQTSFKQVLDQVAKEKKLDVVLYKDIVAQGGTDVTNDVIKKMQ